MASFTPHFILKDKNSEKPTLISCFVRFRYQRIVFSIGESILPQLWDLAEQRPTKDPKIIALYAKGDSQLKQNLKDLTTILNNVSAEIEGIFKDFKVQRIVPTAELVKDRFKQSFAHLNRKGKNAPSKEKKSLSLNEYITFYIDEIETGKRLTSAGRNYQPGSIRSIKGLKYQFGYFQVAKKKKYDFNDITIDFYDDFVAYFNRKDYSPNTIGRLVKDLKTILRAAKEEGINTNTEYERKKFKVLKVDTKQIYLSEDELHRIYELDLKDQPLLDQARDIFLVGCYTAMRFSDFSRLSQDHIKTSSNGTKIIEMITKKTGTSVILPIHPILEAILEKYNYKLPKSYEQKVNKRIKDVGKLAGINELIQLDGTKGGLKYAKSVKKYELIKTHTARRSGATNMFRAGIPSLDIMKLTGHKQESNFLLYIRQTKEQTAERLANHPFFSNKLIKVK
jgi:integrase